MYFIPSGVGATMKRGQPTKDWVARSEARCEGRGVATDQPALDSFGSWAMRFLVRAAMQCRPLSKGFLILFGFCRLLLPGEITNFKVSQIQANERSGKIFSSVTATKTSKPGLESVALHDSRLAALAANVLAHSSSELNQNARHLQRRRKTLLFSSYNQ